MAKKVAAVAGACLLLGADAFVAPKAAGSSAVAGQKFLQAQQATQQAPASGMCSGAALVGAAGMIAVGASAVSGRRAVKSSAPKVCALPKALEGTGGPFPNDVWDPIGLMEGKSEEQLLHWRAVELKHGRVSMLAVLGWAHVAGGWHFIGDAALGYRASDDPLINISQLPMGGLWQMVFFFVCVEWLTAYVCTPPKGRPWDILGWNAIIADEEDKMWKLRQIQEINNGRLAMVAIIGLIFQDALTGVTGFEGIQNFYRCFGMCEEIPLEWLRNGGQILDWPLGPIGFPSTYPKGY